MISSCWFKNFFLWDISHVSFSRKFEDALSLTNIRKTELTKDAPEQSCKPVLIRVKWTLLNSFKRAVQLKWDIIFKIYIFGQYYRASYCLLLFLFLLSISPRPKTITLHLHVIHVQFNGTSESKSSTVY